MKLITFDPDPSEVFVADLDPELVGVPIHLDLDPGATPRLRRSDEVDDHLQTPEGTTTPVLGDPIEHLMLNLVPLARPRREVTHRDPQADLVGPPLQAQLPEPRPDPIAPPAIGRDQQLVRLRIDPLPHLQPPGPERRRRELRRVMVNSDPDPSLIVGQVVEPVRDRLAQLFVFEVMTPRLLGTTRGLILTAPVLEIPNQLLLLRVDRDHGLTSGEELEHAVVDVLELL